MADENIPLEDDLPIEGTETELDLPLDLEGGSTTASMKSQEHLQLGQAAILKSYNEESHVLDAYNEIQGHPSSIQLLSELAASKSDVDIDDLKFSLQEQPGGTTGDILENAEITNEMINESLEDGSNTAKQIVDATSTIDTDPQVAAKIEAQITIMQDIQKLASDYSGWDLTWDIVKGLLPGKHVFDQKSLTGEAFGADELLADVVIGFKSMTAEEQLEVWPTLKQEILDELPENRALPLLAAFIDPTGEESLEDFNSFWAAFDVADIALLGAAVAIRMTKLSKQLNAIRMANELKNKDLAADVNTASMIDDTGKTAEAANIDQITAYSNSAPFNVTALDEAYTEGLSAATVHRIAKVKQQQDLTAHNIAKNESFLKEELLTPVEREQAELAFRDNLVEDGFENINVAGRTSDSTFFDYTLVRDGERIAETGRMDLKIDQVTGVWEQTPSSIAKNAFTSPSVFIKGTAREAVDSAVRLDSSSSKVAFQLKELQTEALKPILGKGGARALLPVGITRKTARRELEELDGVLLEGDNQNKLFSSIEMKAGINGVKMNEHQIEAYYNVRNLYDNLYVIRNAEERRKLVSRGMGEVLLKDGPQVGKVHETSQGAQASINTVGPRKIWFEDARKAVDPSEIDMVKMYEEGYVLTKMKDTIKVADTGESFTYVISRRSATGELPEQILHFKEGYVPRVNKNAYWFVKAVENATVDGKHIEDGLRSTLRFFDNKVEADKWAKAEGIANPKRKLQVLEDREMEAQITGSSDIGAGGGLYTGPRAKKAIPFGKDGLPSERFGAFEALSMNINSLQNHVSRNSWRMGMEQRWVNSAKAAGFNKVDSFDPRLVPLETDAGRGLRKMGEQIEEWSGFPTRDELIWDATVSDTIEWAMTPGNLHGAAKFLDRGTGVLTSKVEAGSRLSINGLHNLRHKDPVAAARAVAFHTLLGAFNPSQLWVQAQGASIALTLGTKLKDPLGGARAIKNQFLVNFLEHAESPALIKKVAAVGGMKAEELTETLALWKRSGLRESILQTADHAAAARSHGIGSDALRRAADTGLFFYRGGELFNRRTSFMIALEEFKQVNKGVKIGDPELKTIVTRATNLMLNLSKANRASWQRGLFSVPTQFLQVQAKILESLLGSNAQFTRGERAKILFGQLGLYGAAGIPAGNLAVRWYAEAIGLDQAGVEELDPTLVKAINEGFWGWYVLTAFNADIELGTRGAVASGLETFLYDLLFTEAPITEKMAGAFGQAPSRFLQSYRKITPLAMGVVAQKRFPTTSELLLAASHLATVTSTWSNVEKAYYMHSFNLLKDRNGYPVSTKDFSLGTEIGVMLGFQPSESRLVRDLTTMNKELSDYRGHISTTLLDSYYNYTQELALVSSEREEDELIAKYEDIHALLLQSLPTDNDRKIVRKAFEAKLKAKSKKAVEINKFLKNFNDGRLSDIHTIHSNFVTKGILRTGVLDEKEE